MKKLFKKPYYCDMRGMLSFLILFLLSKKPMNGQDIASELEKRKGEKPSPGTIYPALKKTQRKKSNSRKKRGQKNYICFNKKRKRKS